MSANAPEAPAGGPAGRARFLPLLYFPIFALLFAAFWTSSIIHRDSFQLFAPYKFLIAEALRRGEVWAWQPWNFLGLPFIAEPQSGWFHPFNLFYLALPFRPAHNLYILAHYPLAAGCMHLFLRGRGRSEAAAMVGALAFSLSGYLVSQHATVTMLIGPALAPLVLFCFDRALRGHASAAVATGAALALQVFGGDLQAVALTAAGLTAWAAVVATGPGRLRPLTMLAIAGVSAILLSAIQLFPTLELLRLSSRGGGLPLEQAQLFSFHPWRIAELVWPDAFGTNWPVMTWWGQFFALEGLRGIVSSGWSASNYLGIPAAALAIQGLMGRPRRERLAFGAVAALALLLALGPHQPLYAFCHRWVPLFDSFRYPEKYLAWFSLAVAALAAGGFDDLVALMRAQPKWIARAFPANLSIIAGLMSFSIYWWQKPLGLLPGPVREFAIDNLWRGAGHLLAVAAACAVAGMVAALLPRARRVAFIAFLLVMVADLWLTNVLIMPQGPGDLWDFQPLVGRALPAGGHSRVLRLPMTFRDHNPALDLSKLARERVWERNTLAANLQAMDFIRSPAGYNPIEFASDRGLLFDGIPGWLIPRLGVEYVIAGYGDPLPEGLAGATVTADPVNDFALYRLDRFLPRAFLVTRAVAEDGPRLTEQLKDENLFRTVVVAGMTAEDAPSAPALRQEVLADEPNRVEVQVMAPAPAWLVLLDRFYPGWEATVDGQPARIYRANGMVRAVRVQAGSHTVSFDYRPASLRAGAAVSGVAWAAAVVWLGVVKRKRKK